MPRKISDDERTKIIELLGEGKSYREIAKIVGRSHGAIAGVATSIGHRSGRSSLARAREARSAFCAERRALSGAAAQERLDELLGVEWDRKVSQALVTKDGVAVVELAPSPADRQKLAQAVELLVRAGIAIDRHDNKADEGTTEVLAWVRSRRGG